MLKNSILQAAQKDLRGEARASQDRESMMEDRESPSSILYLRSSNIAMSLFQEPGSGFNQARGEK